MDDTYSVCIFYVVGIVVTCMIRCYDERCGSFRCDRDTCRPKYSVDLAHAAINLFWPFWLIYLMWKHLPDRNSYSPSSESQTAPHEAEEHEDLV